jgi:hypothetical protein
MPQPAHFNIQSKLQKTLWQSLVGLDELVSTIFDLRNLTKKLSLENLFQTLRRSFSFFLQIHRIRSQEMKL